MDCPICLEPVAGAQITACNHSIHKECLNEWFKYNQSCPICRSYLNFDENQYMRILFIIWIIMFIISTVVMYITWQIYDMSHTSVCSANIILKNAY